MSKEQEGGGDEGKEMIVVGRRRVQKTSCLRNHSRKTFFAEDEEETDRLNPNS